MSALEVAQSASGIRWAPRITDPTIEREVYAIAQQLGVAEYLARVMAGRGVTIDNAADFIAPTLKAFMPDPSHLLDMDKAIARIVQAIQNKETVAVFGDYDVDGATSSALLKRYFVALGLDLIIYIPDRMQEGYGPNVGAFESLHTQGVSLIITVDCGTVSFEPVEWANEHGIDVIVLDHHKADVQLPAAQAVVNPNRIDQDSECGNLAAVGVVFLVLVALNRTLREQGYFANVKEPNLLQWLDMVALGTVCDVVPMKGLNRALVSQGLRVMSQRQNAGITALSDIARVNEPPSTYHAGFVVGPRINAGGRVGEASLGSEILSSDDRGYCDALAAKLDQYNAERKAIEAQVQEEAMLQAEAQHNVPCIVVASEGWHEGVIGIVAGRLKEHFHRPAVVISITDGIGKASARSVTGADMGAAVVSARTEGLLLKGGGHAMAAGFSVEMDKLETLKEYLYDKLGKTVTQYALERTLLYDAQLSVGGVNLRMLDELDKAGPFGIGNPGPRMVLPNVKRVKIQRMKDAHLRVIVGDDSSKSSLVCVCFNVVGTPLGDMLEDTRIHRFHLAGTLKRNRWNGNETVQFMIDDAAAA